MIVNFNEEEAIITYDGLQIHISKSAECEKRGCDGCFYEEKYGEKTADEMFEELGYEKGSGSNLGDGEKFIYYEGHYNDMRLYKKSQKISIHGSFTMQELTAINKKVQELGWKG